MNRLIVTPLKPRNPFVVASRRRLAGLHVAGTGARRQRSRHLLQQELLQLQRERTDP